MNGEPAARDAKEQVHGKLRAIRQAHEEPPPDYDDPGEPAWAGEDTRQAPRPALEILDLADIVARVDASGPPQWLIEGLWPSDAYGVVAAESKAGKTWLMLDLAASVASGTPWLGHFPCPSPGSVLAFLGEGGERSTVRRIRAVCDHKQLDAASLPIRLCMRVPKLKDNSDVQAIEQELEAHPSSLVILDPLYLAAAGAKGSDLFAMGELLTSIQGVCQAAGAALVVVHHWNKTGEGKGAKRMSGSGGMEWGRVLGSAAVEVRKTDPDGTSHVLLGFEFMGGEIPDLEFKVQRRVRAADPADLGSPLEYETKVTAEGADAAAMTAASGLGYAQRRILAALVFEDMQSVKTIGDKVAEDGQGYPLKGKTIGNKLGELDKLGYAEGTEEVPGVARYWSITDTGRAVLEATPESGSND